MPQRPAGANKAATSTTVAVRQRKPHRKSRLGCVNCKLRGVKCDESKPTCSRCTSTGLWCTYSAQAPVLRPAYENVLVLEPGRLQAPQPEPAMVQVLPPALPIAGSTGSYVLRPNDKALVSRFVHDTILTFGPGEAEGHKSRGKRKLTTAHPPPSQHKYLYHIYIGFAQLQEAHNDAVAPGSPRRPSDGATMALHMYHSATMFHQTLAELLPRRRSLSPTERDALWMGASMLATSCFANVDSLDPREVWPLRAGTDLDLAWLRMNQGKDIVWAVADPSRPDSVFRDFYRDAAAAAHLPSAQSPVRPHALPPLFYAVFDLVGEEGGAYRGAVAYLSQVTDDVVTVEGGARLFAFPMEMGEEMKRLLRERDPRALLLLACWHAKLVEYPAWWVKFRCVVEGLAIAMHLRRRHAADMPDLMALLERPRQALLAHFRRSKLAQVWPQEVIDEAEAPYVNGCVGARSALPAAVPALLHHHGIVIQDDRLAAAAAAPDPRRQHGRRTLLRDLPRRGLGLSPGGDKVPRSGSSHPTTAAAPVLSPHRQPPAGPHPSFYRLSKAHHPDANRNDPSAAHTFSLLSESYTLLSDPSRRAAYDRDVLPSTTATHHSHHHHHHHPQHGSYHSSSAHPAGGRPASGLSKRRGTFRGPPPSFYRNGGWGAHAEKRQQHAHDGSSAHYTNYEAAREDPGGRARREEDEVPPHFDKEAHRRTHEHEDARRWARRRQRAGGRALDEEGVEFEPQASLGAHFAIVLGILGATVLVPVWYWNAVRGRRKTKEY
ncbi:Zn(2)-C6 fungal-type DNA-binding domain protein [Cordyceps fumosorosea ARSEF 2679]|uniref:Zn(2)-C6 fungal-type DNA-binding domain protein n=1 Tax=Cordyceps fumosorosea (strain ARSEF 2679) TaxID=1081104 RepID=A0A167QJ40_CORFA|nr:Zn(2)-C6 fungal-type DNA-binding domain protein [Cordyceps fumosorosea ARSEF 2679]OAA57686.1 Zn(2)-C6 fungal-type DNA-binding domain protein [Cordyceps fumosorosea ARSEF 2679]